MLLFLYRLFFVLIYQKNSILVICQELFKKDFDMFRSKKGALNRRMEKMRQSQTLVRLVIQFGVQLLAGVQLVFGQQSKNESYEFT